MFNSYLHCTLSVFLLYLLFTLGPRFNEEPMSRTLGILDWGCSLVLKMVECLHMQVPGFYPQHCEKKFFNDTAIHIKGKKRCRRIMLHILKLLLRKDSFFHSYFNDQVKFHSNCSKN
jgi:hypothetical protein